MAAMLEERMDVVEVRVDRLEAIFGQFMAQTSMTIQRLDRSVERIEATVVEMKAEATRDREEAARRDAAFREETARRDAAFREEAARRDAAFREEAAKDRREMNKRWGELANKMGTIVEDIIAPSLRRMARDEFGCGDERFSADRITRTRSDDPSRRREFDALVVGEYAVLLNETKSSPRPADTRSFVEFVRSGEFALYFPEFAALPVIPVFSSLSIPGDMVTYLTRNGVYAVAMGDEAMQVLNLAQVRGQQAG